MVNSTTKCTNNYKINNMQEETNKETKNILEELNKRELSYGEKSVGLTFNHGEGEIFNLVDSAKKQCAAAIDDMNTLRLRSNDPTTNYPLGMSTERAALATIAIRKLQDAQMQMVKAITWKD